MDVVVISPRGFVGSSFITSLKSNPRINAIGLSSDDCNLLD